MSALERTAVAGIVAAGVGYAIMYTSHLLALDIVGGTLIVFGALAELAVTIYSVATRGLFGRRDR